MAASVLSVRVDSSIKDSFAELCEELGMTSSVAVNMFMRQMLRERSLLFVPSLGKSSASESAATGILDTAQIESAVREAASSIPAIKTVILFGSYARGEAHADSILTCVSKSIASRALVFLRCRRLARRCAKKPGGRLISSLVIILMTNLPR